MLNKKDYQNTFSKVRASEQTYQEVMNMANKRKTAKSSRRLFRVLVAAAMLSILTISAAASEYVQNWFVSYFSDNGEAPLSTEQIEFIEENVQIINQGQTQDDWTVELRSAMNDDTMAYIIIGITAPEGVNLEPRCDEAGNLFEFFTPGNAGMVGGLAGAPDIVTCSEGVAWSELDFKWEEDGDGLENTKNLMIQIWPDLERCTVDPFGNAAQYYIHIENIVREYEDEAYRQELMNGKYAGQTDIMFTPEETVRLRCAEVLAEGIWDFTISFAESGSITEVEMLAEPIRTMANIWRKYGESLWEYDNFMEEVTITSFVLRPLSATIFYEDCNGAPSFNYEDKVVSAVMKDGSQIELLPYGSSGTNYVTLEAETPLVLEEVDHILMADGTRIPMPE